MKKDEVTAEIIVKENKVGILRVGNVNYISLTDLAKQANSEDPSGKKFIILILIWSNSTKLKLSMVEILLQCLHLNGSKEPMQ